LRLRRAKSFVAKIVFSRFASLGTKLHSALPWPEKNLVNLLWRVIALAAVIGLAGCGAKDFETPLRSSDAVAPYVGAGNESPGTFALLDPEKIRYSQATYSVGGRTADGSRYTVQENIQWLLEHPTQDLPWGGPIRVFRKQAFMDEWGPLTRDRHTGDPKNLEVGEIYTLNHRRLVAYKLAGRKTIPVEWTNLRLVRDQRWRFTTANRGRSIAPNP
jgi:hypothetical protein